MKSLSTENEQSSTLDDAVSKVLFYSAKIPMLIISPSSGSIVSVNDAACKYYGYSRKQFSLMTIQQINQLSSAEVSKQMANAAEEGRSHFYFIHKLADGRLRNVEVHSGPISLSGREYLYSIVHDITKRHEAEKQLADLNRDFITLLENTTDFVYFKDINSRFRFCSQTLANITGHNSWRDMIGKHDSEVFPSDTANIYIEEEQPIFKQGTALLNQVNPFYDEKGNRGWVSTNKWPVFDAENKAVVGLFGISRDVTLQHNALNKLNIAASVFQRVSEGILITDSKNRIIDANEAFCQLSGYQRDDILGRSPSFLNSDHHDQAFFTNINESLMQSGEWRGDIWNRKKDGSLMACRTTINVITDEQGKEEYRIYLFSDVTQTLQHVHEVEYLAYHDALTELPNRILFNDRLERVLAEAKRYQYKNIAVCFIDLDKFKPVNDHFGHRTGDLLLKEVASRLMNTIRTVDTVARLGGDEFALILSHTASKDETLRIIERTLREIAKPFSLLGGNKVAISASIGVCFLNDKSVYEPSSLLRHADRAMYEAKSKGRNCYHVYSELEH